MSSMDVDGDGEARSRCHGFDWKSRLRGNIEKRRIIVFRMAFVSENGKSFQQLSFVDSSIQRLGASLSANRGNKNPHAAHNTHQSDSPMHDGKLAFSFQNLGSALLLSFFNKAMPGWWNW